MPLLLAALLPAAPLTPVQADQSQADETAPTLYRNPATNGDTIVFEYANDLWRVGKSGGAAVRLTTGPGAETAPRFSPDGKTVAFTGEYDGNADVFTIPAEGGVPKRLTAHPANDRVLGWSPDGTSVLFSSEMLSNTDDPRLYTVPKGGGMPKALPFPSGSQGSFSPDGQQIAYVPNWKWQPGWKRYRGGQQYRIWIADLADSKWKPIPRKDSDDGNPMWVGDRIYFLSDRGPSVRHGLYSYAPGESSVREEIAGEEFDLKSASAGGGLIAYEKFGRLYTFDPKTRRSAFVPVAVAGDFPEVRQSFKNLGGGVQSASLSPSAARVAMTSRGYLLTAPAQKGDARVEDERGAIHRRDVAWSPDGKTLAYFTDERGGYQLALRDAATGTERILPLGEPNQYYYQPVWSPDATKIAYTDNRHQVWIMDARTGENTRVDAGIYEDPNTGIVPRWSPDSNWLTYARDLDNHLNAVFLYSVKDKKVTQVTDALVNAKLPAFDRDGKHLYFVGSTNTGWAASYLDLTSVGANEPTSSVYALVLKADGENPLSPQSDEEPTGDPAKPEEKKDEFRIDLEGIESRVVTLPLPQAAYSQIEPGAPGTFFTVSNGQITKFDVGERDATPFGRGFVIQVSAKGDKMLVQGFGAARIVGTMAPFGPQGGEVSTNVRVKLDPRAEWAQVFDEVCRNEKIFFYDAGLHGQNMDALKAKYRPFLANVSSRADLTYLLEELVGELSIGHMWVNGGDQPYAPYVAGGLLGADFEFVGGKARLTRVYTGESWNPGLRAPLAGPGVMAKAGEYLLEINGKPVDDSIDLYALLEGKAGRQIKVKLGPTPDGKGARVVTVIPVASEFGLRQRAWAEDNRRRVAAATNGRAAYVHVPDTAFGGWTAFQRYYFAQADKDAAVIDERFNHGGLINDYMIHEMLRTPGAVFTPRNGKDWPTPGLAIFGPKVMLINANAGSGGDMFPWLFRHYKVGPLIGKRTWGGLVRSFGFETLDGGSVNAPDVSFYNPWTGKWEVEGYGVAPDMDVELDPYLWRQGKDAQLERAIVEINERLKTYKAPVYKRPAGSNKVGKGSDGF